MPLGAGGSERYVVAACLGWPRDVVPSVAEIVRHEDFSRPDYRMLFKAIEDLYVAERGVDLVAVRGLLDQGALEKAGCLETLEELRSEVTQPETAVDHARRVRDAARRRQLGETGLRITSLAAEEGLTYPEALAGAHEALGRLDLGRETGPVAGVKVVEEVLERLDGAQIGGRHVRTGLDSYNRRFGALAAGEMVVIAARPSVGKTSFASQIALNAAAAGSRVLFFSFEVPRVRLVLNMLCNLGRIDSALLRVGETISQETYAQLSAAIVEFSPLDIAIDDASTLSPFQVRATALRFRASGGLDLLVIDYLGLMDTRSVVTRGGNREAEVAWLSRTCKGLAKDLDVPVLVLSQLNRQSTHRVDGRPLLSDLRDSGGIEQDADVVLLLHREDLRAPGARNDGTGSVECEVIVAKNRNGPVGTLPLLFEGACYRFYDVGEPR